VVQQHDDLAGAARRGQDAARILPEEGAREGEHQQRDGGTPEQQEKPVVDLASLHGLVRDSPEEHQRREVDDLLPLALDEMDQDRDGHRREPEKEDRGQE
jgi:hypothetical protein